MKTVELTEEEIRLICVCIEDALDKITKNFTAEERQILLDARHKLFMSLMDSPVPGDTKFIPD